MTTVLSNVEVSSRITLGMIPFLPMGSRVFSQFDFVLAVMMIRL